MHDHFKERLPANWWLFGNESICIHILTAFLHHMLVDRNPFIDKSYSLQYLSPLSAVFSSAGKIYYYCSQVNYKSSCRICEIM